MTEYPQAADTSENGTRPLRRNNPDPEFRENLLPCQFYVSDDRFS